MRPHLSFAFLTLFALFSNSYSQVSWEKVNFPASPGGVHSLSIDPPGNIYASGDSGTYRSTDKGVSWNRIFPDQRVAGNFVFSSTGSIYGVVYQDPRHYMSQVFESTDGGQTWIDAGLPYQGMGITLAVDNLGRVLAATYDAGIFRTSNQPGTWDHILLDKPPFDCITVDPQGRIYAGTWDRGVFRSTDDGGTWRFINTGFPTSWTTFQVENVVSQSNGQLYASADSVEPIEGGAVSGGIFRSTDNGDTWIDMTSNLTNEAVWGLTVDPIGDLFMAVAANGMYRSSDNGNSWVGIGGPPSNTLGAPVADPDGIVYQGTNIGLYRTPRTTGVNQSHGEVPTAFALSQNYPNPFNPATTIQYALPQRSHMTLTVFNALGQTVAELVNGEITAGYHSVQFDGSGLASGVYYYRLATGSFVETKKLLLIR